ncbi:LysR family transcriptional regulator [Demequina rhizosphaerae]|uniref:LysR family transcriptional regulator n=1 Tax=Demequina rhizosphaerae TaxID=1638985 RepID=UPI0007831D78|nr:LysR family transcriptional regulator [Demequina rhizosphaerae]
MDLRQMEYVVAVADERHFTRAAALVGVSQSGLSASVRALEDELGAPLFERTTRRVELTEAGRAFLPYARTMLTHATRARDAVVDASREVSGTLRIGAEQCLGIVDVSALLERFHHRHPRVEVHYVEAGSHDLVARVRAGELDVAFAAAAEHLGALPSRALGQEDLVLLCPPSHPAASSARVRWADLQGFDFVDFHPSWAMRPLNDAAVAAAGGDRRVRFTVGDVHTLISFVGRGLGVAVVPSHVAAKPEAQGLVAVPLEGGAGRWTVSVVWAPRDRADSPTPRLLQLLDGAAGCLPAQHEGPRPQAEALVETAQM